MHFDWTTYSIASRRIACCALSVRWTAFAALFGPFGVVATTSPTIVKADQSFAAAKHTSVAAILISLILAIWRYRSKKRLFHGVSPLLLCIFGGILFIPSEENSQVKRTWGCPKNDEGQRPRPNGRLHRVVFYLARDPSGSSTGEAKPCPFQRIRLRNTPRYVSNWPENPTLPMFAPACRIWQGNGYWPAYKRGKNETSVAYPAAEFLDPRGKLVLLH